MKKQIKIIESKSNLDLNFGIPQAQLSDEQLSKLYGGNTFNETCTCHKGKLTPCVCYGTGTLIK